MIGYAFFGNDFGLPIIKIIEKKDYFSIFFEVSPNIIRFFNLLQFKDNKEPSMLILPKPNQPKIYFFQKNYSKENVGYLSYTPLWVLISTTFTDDPTDYSKRKEIFQEIINNNKEIIESKKKEIYMLSQTKIQCKKQLLQDLEDSGERTKKRLATLGHYEFVNRETGQSENPPL